MKRIIYKQVYRTKPLPISDIRGRYVIPESILENTLGALQSFKSSRLLGRPHEGLVYWAGLEISGQIVFTSVVIPKSKHWPQGVMVSEKNFGASARAARKFKQGLLCQVHSHPGSDARHSDGDDDLITLPFNDMLSIVVPYYGKNFSNIHDARIHQFQDGRWILCEQQSVQENIVIVPSVIDLR